MSGPSVQSGGKKKARIEIIPLIDVIFFLLATFVLFTLSLNKTGGVRVMLPHKDLILVDELIPRLKAFYAQNPEGRILINGDEEALFNAAIYVFDEARKTGFKKVFIETKVRAVGRS